MQWGFQCNAVLSPVLMIFVVVLFPLFYSSFGELDNADLYPIIINTDADKAVFILPELGCHVVQDFRLINRIMVNRQQHPNVYRADEKTVDSISQLCNLYQNDVINATQFVINLREKSLLIFPGTHFCGAGNDAANYSDLGYYIDTDKCCREHDYCTDFVSGWSCHSTIPELCNYSPFTRSHCYCDHKFRECLLRVNDSASVHIGILYFTVFGLKCFREDYPIVKCEEYGGFLNIHCQRYILNTTSQKSYQFFDSPKFSLGKVSQVNLATRANDAMTSTPSIISGAHNQ